jgi:hypothetical protein
MKKFTAEVQATYSIDMQCCEPGDVWESIYIFIYLREWVLENWWYENRTYAVILVPMPFWTFILISTLSFTLISVLHIDVNGRGSTAPSDVCANRPIYASYKGLWCVRRILCDFCANFIFLKADNVRSLYWFNRSSIKFLTTGTILCFMYICSYHIHTTIMKQKYEINIKYL